MKNDEFIKGVFIQDFFPGKVERNKMYPVSFRYGYRFGNLLKLGKKKFIMAITYNTMPIEFNLTEQEWNEFKLMSEIKQK